MSEDKQAAIIVQDKKESLIEMLADRYELDPKVFLSTIKATIMPSPTATTEQVASFLVVCNQYDLNPFLKEIYAFPSKGGGIQPMVPIDGWIKLVNRHPMHDGHEFSDMCDDSGKVIGITCRMYRKDRSRPSEVTEYMAECSRNTEPWNKWPNRMLRHKAFIQCARLTYGFAGIIEPDEAERYAEVGAIVDMPQAQIQARAAELKSRLAAATAPVEVEKPVAPVATMTHPILFDEPSEDEAAEIERREMEEQGS
jgi:phage recombination protein Bet